MHTFENQELKVARNRKTNSKVKQNKAEKDNRSLMRWQKDIHVDRAGIWTKKNTWPKVYIQQGKSKFII